MSSLLTFEGGDISLEVRRVIARERMSDLFTIDVLARSLDPNLELASFVGLGAALRCDSLHGVLVWTGVCSRMELVHIEPLEGAYSAYELRIVPNMWLLTQRRGHRIFQHMKTTEIVEAVLGEYGIAPEMRLAADHPKHEYRVQHGETDYAFVCRLLEEAGISFFFERDDTLSKLIISDDPRTTPSEGTVDFFDRPNEGQREKLFVTDVKVNHRVRAGETTYRDYDFRHPKFLVEGKSKYPYLPGEEPEKKYERYFFQHGGSVVDDADAGDKVPVGDDRSVARHVITEFAERAQRVSEAQRFGKRLVSFRSNHPVLYPSRVFSIDRHPRGEIGRDNDLFIVESVTTIDELDWSVTGYAMLKTQPFRPMVRTAKPRVMGPQTAMVVGPKGEEIYVDEYGRVRVQFHWDREGKFDTKTTCWLRVSQSWAGAAYGSMMIPRIGQEVIVDFFDGDPDQPVVVGRLFNNTTVVPRVLPDKKTQTIFRTASTPHSDGFFNEMSFDDAAGKELLFLQAQRDLYRLTKRHDTDRTGEDRTIIVGEGRVAGIAESNSLQFGGQHLIKMVKPGNLNIEEMGEPESSPTTTYVEMVPNKITLTTGQATMVLDGGDITVDAKGALRFTTDGRMIMKGSTVTLNVSSGSASVGADFTVADAVKRPTRVLPAVEAEFMQQAEEVEFEKVTETAGQKASE